MLSLHMHQCLGQSRGTGSESKFGIMWPESACVPIWKQHRLCRGVMCGSLGLGLLYLR